MSIEIKIHMGTGRLTGVSLCQTCEHSTAWTDARGEHVSCSMMHKEMQPQGRVTECSSYYNKGLPSLHDMRASAWTLRTEKGGKNIGFTPPKPRHPDLEDL